MAKLLPADFKEFLKLCNRKRVKYLLIGGYAVNIYGHHRATGDMDVWIEMSEENADRVVATLREFGFDVPNLNADLFLKKGNIVRMGVPPLRLEILNDISGVVFEDCYPARLQKTIDGIKIDIINLDHLLKNKSASGRPKDLDDLEHLS